MMGHYTYEGPVWVLCKERAQIGRYDADHGVALPCRSCEYWRGQTVTTHEIVPSFLQKQIKWYWNGSRHMSNDSSYH